MSIRANKLASAFSKVDIFGSQIQLSFNKSKAYQSAFGGVLSIFLVVGLAIFFWRNRTFDANPSDIYLTNKNFMFAIRFNSNNFLTNPYFNISLSQGMIKTDQDGTQQSFSFSRNLEPCTIDHFVNLPTYGANWTQIYYQNNLKDFLCLAEETYLIGGDYTSSSFSYLQFSVSNCSNSTGPDQLWRPQCKSEDELEQYLKNNIFGTVNIYFPTVMVNPDEPNEEQSVVTYLNTDTYFYLQPGRMYKTAEIFLTQYDITTDNSLLPTKQESSMSFPLYETKDFREQALLGSNQNYADFYIRRSFFSVKINRSFTKLDEIIAYIGGFVEAFLVFLSFFVEGYNECLFSVALANKLYDFEIDPDNDEYLGASKQQTPGKNMKSNNLDDSDIVYRKKLYNACVRKMSYKQASYSNLLSLKKQRKNERTKSSIYLQKSSQQDNSSDQDSVQNQEITFQNQVRQDTESLSKIPDRLKNVQVKKRIRRTNLMNLKKNSNVNHAVFNSQNSLKKNEMSTSHERYNTIAPSIFSPLSSTNNQNTSDKKLFTSSKFSLFSPSQIGLLNDKSSIKNSDIKIDLSNAELKEIVGNQDQEVSAKPESKTNQKYFKSITFQNQQKIEQNSNSEIQNLNDFEEKKQALHKVLNLKRSFKKLEYLKGEFKSLLSKSKNQIVMTWSYIMFKLSCKQYFRTKNNMLIEKSQELLEEQLDIFVLLEKMKEINKLKELFLDKEQQILFNFFPKPVIKAEQEEDFQLSKGSLLDLHKNTPKDKNSQLGIFEASKKAGILSPNNPKNLKTVGLFAQAISKLKKGIKAKSHVPSSIDAYKRLYECYLICNQNKNQIQDDYDRSQQNSAASKNKNKHFEFDEDIIIENFEQTKGQPENQEKEHEEYPKQITKFEEQDTNQENKLNIFNKNNILFEGNKNAQQNQLESNKENSSSDKDKEDSNLKSENLFSSQQNNFNSLFSKSGFLRNKIEQNDNNQNILGSSLFISTNTNNDIILNSALRKKESTHKDFKKKIQFKQSCSIKDSSDEADDKTSKNNENEDNYQQMITCFDDEDDQEEEGNNFRVTNSNCEIMYTQQDTLHTENDDCLAPRKQSFSSISNKKNKPQLNQLNQYTQSSFHNQNLQTVRKLSQGLTLNHQNSNPFINLLGSNRSILETETQPNLDEQISKSQEKFIERTQSRKKSKNAYSIFSKNSKLSFQEQPNYYLQKLSKNEDSKQIQNEDQQKLSSQKNYSNNE